MSPKKSVKLQILTKENICAVHMKTVGDGAVGSSNITHVDCRNTELVQQIHRKQSYAGTCALRLTEVTIFKWRKQITKKKDMKGDFSHQALHSRFYGKPNITHFSAFSFIFKLH